MDRNPQAREMADESMVRNLAAQAQAIWPQEERLFHRYADPGVDDVLDVGCGTGEISARVAALFPDARVTGVDLIESHLELARQRYADVGDRLTFQQGDAFELPFADASFDLVICRHMLQAIPTPERVIAELVRVTRPGGWLHLLCEDYHMIFGAPARRDLARFWFEAPRAYGKQTGVDLHIGRTVHQHLVALGLVDLGVHYIHVDTERVPRETFATIFEAWRDGYAEPLSKVLGWPEPEVRDHFDAMIECVRDPAAFALWLVPVWTARKP